MDQKNAILKSFKGILLTLCFFATAKSGNSQCAESISPDLPLIPTTPTIEAEMNTIISRYSDDFLGTSAPSNSALNSANNQYAALNIVVSGGNITGNTISSYNSLSFLTTYAQYLKFNPNDVQIQQRASKVVWLASSQYCDGTLAHDNNMYQFKNFIRPAVFISPYLNNTAKELFKYIVYSHTASFSRFYVPVYDHSWQSVNGSINTDEIYNISDALLGYALIYSNLQERYRYLRTYKRYLERFMSYSSGSSNGIKPDGTGFHHAAAYNNYMYAYKTATNNLFYLRGTSFQIQEVNYKVFRDAVYCLYIQANNSHRSALSSCGRKPQIRQIPFDMSSLERLAIVGGEFSGVNEDILLAGLYNRLYGPNPNFSYAGLNTFDEGFFNMNHANLGVFRKDNTVIVNNGFSASFFGAELYSTSNRYGRYQSYGAMEVIYPESNGVNNGYDVNTWDWNFHPGTTVIKLPWTKLHGEFARIDERQYKNLVGSVSIDRGQHELLSNTRGQNGLFAMDFKERATGWSTVYSSTNYHNETFEFKKSNFYFDDVIVCLGSDIKNNDSNNPTITTLFQRLDNNGIMNVNGTNISNNGLNSYSSSPNRWVISNYGTGYYLVSTNDILQVNKQSQSTPNHNDNTPASFNTPSAVYCIGYLDHGVSPAGKSYEYILIPDATTNIMQGLENQISTSGKPYIIHQQDSIIHSVEHISTETWGYAFFQPASNLSYGPIKSVDHPCLTMTKPLNNGADLMLTVSNPDMGIPWRSNAPSVAINLQIVVNNEWQLAGNYSNTTIISSNPTETVLEITLNDGIPEEIILEQVNNSTSITWTNQPVNITIECDESNLPGNTGYATATTSCSGNISVTYSDNVNTGNCPQNQTITRTWIAMDGCNNLESFDQLIHTVDTTPPTINCNTIQDSVFIQEDSTYMLIDYTGTVSVSDNCSLSPVISQTPSVGTILPAGVHEISLTATDECGNSSNCSLFLDIVLINGVAPHIIDSELKIYPNPTKDIITITSQYEKKMLLKVFDLNGKAIMSKNIYSGEQVDLRKLESGIYFIGIQYDGKKTIKKLSLIE